MLDFLRHIPDLPTLKIGDWEFGIGTFWTVKGDMDVDADWYRVLSNLEFDMTYCECKQIEDPSQPCRCGQEIVHMYEFSLRKFRLRHLRLDMAEVVRQDP